MAQGTPTTREALGARRTAAIVCGATAGLAAFGLAWKVAGPRSMRARYAAAESSPFPPPDRVATESDLDGLPPAVARWLRGAGVVGRPVPTGMRVRFTGRIRDTPEAPWMTFTGAQVSTFAPRWTRWFHLDARVRGLPAEVLHVMEDGHATMRADALSLVPVVREAGPEMDAGEAVTMLNDLCLMAPGALLDAPVAWEDGGDRAATAVWSDAGVTVAATLQFDEAGRLVGFTSRDRYRRAGPGDMRLDRWSTPLSRHGHADDGVTVGAQGDARWGEGDEEWVYLELRIDSIGYAALPGVKPTGAAG